MERDWDLYWSPTGLLGALDASSYRGSVGVQLLGVGLVSGVSRDSDPEKAGMDSDYAHDSFGRGDELSSDGDVESNPGTALSPSVGGRSAESIGEYTGSGLGLEQLVRTVSRLKRVLHVKIALERAYGLCHA